MKTKILFLVTIVVTGFSCQEVFNPEDLDQSAKIPVVLGSLREGKGPFTVSLYWASAFDGNRMNVINGAKVSVLDDLGNVYLYKQIAPGFYVSDTNKLIGTNGRKYALKIVTLENLTLESAHEFLDSRPKLDTLYAEIGNRIISTKDAYGDLITSTQNGLYIYTNYYIESDKQQYLKFNSLVVSQSFSILTGENPPTVYYREIQYSDDVPNVKSTFLLDSNQVIKRHNIAFLTYIFNPNAPNDSMQAGWLINLTATSISAKAFRYYQLISEQLSASSRVFDPIPSKITGNIRCINDSLKTVLGLFEVGSSTSICYGFNWYTGAKCYRSQKVDGPGPIENNNDTNSTPEGWVWINTGNCKE